VFDFLAPLTTHAAYIESTAKWFAEYTRSNPVIGGVIGVWLLTTITFFLRAVPNTIWDFFLRHFTVEVTVHNKDNAFYHLLEWYEAKGFGKRARTLRIHRVDGGGQTLSAGFGFHYFWRGLRLFKMTRGSEETQMGMDVKEIITITTYGRSQAPIRKLFVDVKPKRFDNLTSVYSWSGSGWSYQTTQDGRTIKSVVLPEVVKNSVLNHLKRFKDDADFYLDNGIPYRTGICLHGSPGTGKTSLVRALCDYLKKDLYRLSLNYVTDATLESALSSVPGNGIVLIEDIDTFSVAKTRKIDRRNMPKTNRNGAVEVPVAIGDHGGKTPDLSLDKFLKDRATPAAEPAVSDYESLSFLTLSGVLNAIDGVTTSKGRILIMTTNHVENLDSALMRTGRVDLTVQLPVLDDETFRDMFARFYPDYELPASNIEWYDGITPAEFQSYVIENRKDPEQVLRLVSTLRRVVV